jgi:hypothetical protein
LLLFLHTEEVGESRTCTVPAGVPICSRSVG